MSEAELIDRYIDALKRNPKATPPLGLDAHTADFVRALVLSGQAKTPGKPLQDRVWHKALTQAENGTGEFISRPRSSNDSTQNVTRSKLNGRFEEYLNHTIPLEPPVRVMPGTRPPQARYIFQYTATIAAMLLVLVLVGGVLIQMAKTPNSGYLAAESLETATPTIEPTPVCNASSDYMAQGEASIAAGDYAAALTAYKCAIEMDSTNLAAHLLRGSLLAANGDYNQAGYDYYTFIAPNDTDIADPAQKPILKILPTLKHAIEARPDDAVLYILRGLVLTSVLRDAPIDMLRLKQLAPHNAVGYLFSRNWPYTYDEADADLQKAIQIAPDSVLLDFWLWRGLSEQNAAFAKPYFDRAIQANSKHPFAYQARGVTDIFMGDMAAAAHDFYQHIQNNPTGVIHEDNLTVGQVYALKGIAASDVFRLSFTARAGQQLSMVTTANTGRFPPTLVVLDPEGNVMPVWYTVYDTSPTVSIKSIVIPETGTYTLLARSNSDIGMGIGITEVSS